MTDYIRVRSLATGHETTIAEPRFNPARWKRVDKPAVDRGGRPLPPKPRTDLAGNPAPRRTSGLPVAEFAYPSSLPTPTSLVEPTGLTVFTPDPVPDAEAAPATGHPADYEGES